MRRFGYIDVAVYQGAKDLPPMEVAHPLTGACTPLIVICPVMNSTHRRTYNLYDLFYLWTSLPRGKTIGAAGVTATYVSRSLHSPSKHPHAQARSAACTACSTTTSETG